MNYELAEKVADAAAYLDILKNTRSPAERIKAAVHVEALHDAAEYLAGDRVNELYAPDDGSVYSTSEVDELSAIMTRREDE